MSSLFMHLIKVRPLIGRITPLKIDLQQFQDMRAYNGQIKNFRKNSTILEKCQSGLKIIFTRLTNQVRATVPL